MYRAVLAAVTAAALIPMGAPAGAAAHPKKKEARDTAQARFNVEAGSHGGVRVNRVGRHVIVATANQKYVQGEHYRTAFGRWLERCGRRGGDICIRPVQADVNGANKVIGFRKYPLHVCRPNDGCEVTASAAYTRATVDHVTDGDTVVTSAGRVRLLAIDTPEVFFHRECGGPEASRKMKSLLQPGDRVRLIRDSTQGNTDRYGRLLRYIHVTRRGSDDVGYEMVRTGWAEVYEAFPARRTPKYRKAQAVARRHHRGVWGLCGGFES